MSVPKFCHPVSQPSVRSQHNVKKHLFMFCWPCILALSLQITNLAHNFSCMFISILYMFRADMYPSSGELLYQCDTWFMSPCVDDRLVCRSICSCAQFFMYVYFYSLHVSGSHVPIITSITVSIRHLVYVTLCRWPSGMQEHMLLHTRRSSTHWYNNSPDDGYMAARNMQRIEINIQEKIVRQVSYLQG